MKVGRRDREMCRENLLHCGWTLEKEKGRWLCRMSYNLQCSSGNFPPGELRMRIVHGPHCTRWGAMRELWLQSLGGTVSRGMWLNIKDVASQRKSKWKLSAESTPHSGCSHVVLPWWWHSCVFLESYGRRPGF